MGLLSNCGGPLRGTPKEVAIPAVHQMGEQNWTYQNTGVPAAADWFGLANLMIMQRNMKANSIQTRRSRAVKLAVLLDIANAMHNLLLLIINFRKMDFTMS